MQMSLKHEIMFNVTQNKTKENINCNEIFSPIRLAKKQKFDNVLHWQRNKVVTSYRCAIWQYLNLCTYLLFSVLRIYPRVIPT